VGGDVGSERSIRRKAEEDCKETYYKNASDEKTETKKKTAGQRNKKKLR